MTDLDRMVSVAEVMRRDQPTVSPGDSIATVARIMTEHQLPGVPVVHDGEIVGIVTESDLVAREADISVPTIVPFLDALVVSDGGRDFDEDMRRVLALTAGDLMTSPVFNIRATATLSQAATLMIDHGINPLPVVNEDLQLVGIVSRADLVRVIGRLESDTNANPAT